MPGQDLHSLARNLRKHQTPAEILLWSKLRAHQLSGFKFRRQHPTGPYILDFYCPELRLAIELDGGQHVEDGNILNDVQRTEYLREIGIRVIRFWNHEVFQYLNDVVAEIEATIQDILAKTDVL